jgi:hypothetical protein
MSRLKDEYGFCPFGFNTFGRFYPSDSPKGENRSFYPFYKIEEKIVSFYQFNNNEVKNLVGKIVPYFLVTIFILLCRQSYGQRQWLYLHDGIQSGYLNTAYLSNKQWQIALPDFSMDAGLSGLRLNKVIDKLPTGYEVNGDKIINEINEAAKFHSNIDVNFLSIGRRIGNGYLSSGFGARGVGNIKMSKELSTLLLKGNEPFIGIDQNFQFRVQYQVMHQIYIGYAQQFNKVNLGIKVKYLNGLSALNTNNSSISLNTASNSYETSVKNNLDLHSTYPISLDSNFKAETPTANFTKNNGFGIDLGMEYNISEGTAVMISVNDLGKINWNDKVYQYNNNKESIVRGLNVKDLIDGKEISIEDTLTELFKVSPSINSNFTTALGTRVNIGGRYQVDQYTFAAMFSNQFYSYGSTQNISLMATNDLAKWLRLGLSYTFREGGHYAGFSAGLKLGAVKLMLSTQNALAPLGLKYINSYNAIGGISIEFGNLKINKYEDY